MVKKNNETILQIVEELKQTGKCVVYNFGTFEIVKTTPKNNNLGKAKRQTKIVFKPCFKARNDFGKLSTVLKK